MIWVGTILVVIAGLAGAPLFAVVMAAAAWWLERRRPETYREQKDQGSRAAAEETTIRIIYEAEVAKDLKPWTRSNNGEQPKRSVYEPAL